jgi:hypothetical protein
MLPLPQKRFSLLTGGGGGGGGGGGAGACGTTENEATAFTEESAVLVADIVTASFEVTKGAL